MLGLFLMLPVLALYAQTLPDYSPELLGLAMGAYGLTQAVLQIPFGRWSDRMGRKPLITIGLVLFAAGSLLGALVQFGRVVTIEPGAGALAFCAVVFVTIIAAEAFDPRLMWDAAQRNAHRPMALRQALRLPWARA